MENYSYITLVTSDSYVKGAILLAAGLKATNSKYPFLCLVTDTVSKEALKELEVCRINYKYVDNIEVSKEIYEHNKSIDAKIADTWKYTLTKFRIWEQEEYDKLIFLDSDLLILKNLDHCFEYEELTAAVDGEYFNLWPNDMHFNSGFMVIKPNKQTFLNLIQFANSINPKTTRNYLNAPYVIADQDILNMYFSNWKNEFNKHLSKYYNIFAPYILKSMEDDVIKSGYFIHYIGLKPWQLDDYIKLEVLKSYRSSYVYCLGTAIVETIYSEGFDNFTGIDRKIKIFAANIAKNVIFDSETARKFYTDINVEKAADVNPFIMGLVKYMLEQKDVASGLMLFDDLVMMTCGDTDTILKYYNLFKKAIKTEFGKY